MVFCVTMHVSFIIDKKNEKCHHMKFGYGIATLGKIIIFIVNGVIWSNRSDLWHE